MAAILSLHQCDKLGHKSQLRLASRRVSTPVYQVSAHENVADETQFHIYFRCRYEDCVYESTINTYIIVWHKVSHEERYFQLDPKTLKMQMDNPECVGMTRREIVKRYPTLDARGHALAR